MPALRLDRPLVWSEVPGVLFGRPSSSVRGTMCAMDRGQVVQSEVLNVLLDQCQSVRSEVLSMLSDVCQTVHSVGSFHLPFRLPFLLSFALSSALSLSFPFLSPPQTLAEIILGDTSCNRSSWAFTLVLSPQPY